MIFACLDCPGRRKILFNVLSVSEVPSEARNLDGVPKARNQIRSVIRRWLYYFHSKLFTLSFNELILSPEIFPLE